ncbi:MAG: SH3 domain-containing protein [Spirochaetia bacterium]|nr:SH3 domain-containing protein [Spirochaetia bacterium]
MSHIFLRQKLENQKQKTVFQKITRVVVIIFPLLFFLASIYLVFVKIQQGPLVEIENELNNQNWMRVISLVEEYLKEETLSRKHLLVYGSIAEYALAEENPDYKDEKYMNILIIEDSTRIFLNESYLQKLEKFSYSKNFLKLLCRYNYFFPGGLADNKVTNFIEKGFKSTVYWNKAEISCYENIFQNNKDIFQDKIKQINADNVNIRLKPSLDSEILSQIKRGANIIIREEGPSMTIDNKTNKWFFVLTENSDQGWIFGSFISD